VFTVYSVIASTIAGAGGTRQPTENELQGLGIYQGRKIAETANKLYG
jgi:hypothetical protein